MRHRVLLTLGCLMAFGAVVLGPKWVQGWVTHAQSGATYVINTYAAYQTHTLNHPTGLAFGYQYQTVGYAWVGNLYIADTGNNVIRVFRSDWNPPTLFVAAGNGTAGHVDGSPSSAEFSNPTGITVYTFGALNHYYPGCSPNHVVPWDLLYISDSNNQMIRTASLPGLPTEPCFTTPNVGTAAGNGTSGLVDGAAATAQFRSVAGVATSTPGATPHYIADSTNNVIRVWDSSPNTVSTFAGTGGAGLVNGSRASAQFNMPSQAAWDTAGNIFVTDTGNHAIRKIDTGGNVTTLAGSGQIGSSDGLGASARFYMPTGMVFNPADNHFYIADSGNNMIRKIDLSGNVTTYSGAIQGGLVNGTLSQARYQSPTGLVISNGFMYVSDTMNNAIRRIDMTQGVVSTYIN
jgi:hypothetical protein